MISVPSYLMPVEGLNACEVAGEIKEKVNREGERKYSDVFGSFGWIIPVEVVRGSRVKMMADGELKEVLEVTRLNVTLWSDTKPPFSAGDYIAFNSLYFGAVDGSLFVYALGAVEVKGDK